ncbi:unnamed protein product [Candida verbasci]|uniref:Phosphomutase-like protein 3 n=1 Tax=Candida verbasci TaxID=1227364 RepID=A0A9W4XF14_9ASCO|nr:unnamed protein product [Candida verbasci]
MVTAIKMVSLISLLSTAVLSQVVLSKSVTLPKLTSSDKYFEQSDPNIPVNQIDDSKNFGLKSEYTWSDVTSQLDDSHKLFYIQRHSEGWHQIAKSKLGISDLDWDCYWQEQDGKDGIVWADAELTPNGVQQSKDLSNQIQNTNGLPWPQKWISSPLRRTLQTWNLTWLNLKHDTPLIIEFARETYGIQTESQRHPKSYIQKNFPIFEFESGFTENDELWSSKYREPGSHRKYRAAQLINQIFDDFKDQKIISLVSHSGLIGSILDVVGHRSIPIENGKLLPILIHQKPHKTEDYDVSKPSKTFKDVCPNPPSTISGVSSYTTPVYTNN